MGEGGGGALWVEMRGGGVGSGAVERGPHAVEASATIVHGGRGSSRSQDRERERGEGEGRGGERRPLSKDGDRALHSLHRAAMCGTSDSSVLRLRTTSAQATAAQAEGPVTAVREEAARPVRGQMLVPYFLLEVGLKCA